MEVEAALKVWLGFLLVVTVFVVLNVNFGFQNDFLKSELIEHTAISIGKNNYCICATCGKNGLAYCLHCGTPMNWSKGQNLFSCPNCTRTGQPRCPNCNSLMVGVGKNSGGGTSVGSPIPVF